MDATISDVTTKTVPKADTYYMKIFNRLHGTMLEVDMERSISEEKLINIISLALQNGRKWKKWDKSEKAYKDADVPK